METEVEMEKKLKNNSRGFNVYLETQQSDHMHATQNPTYFYRNLQNNKRKKQNTIDKHLALSAWNNEQSKIKKVLEEHKQDS